MPEARTWKSLMSVPALCPATRGLAPLACTVPRATVPATAKASTTVMRLRHLPRPRTGRDAAQGAATSCSWGSQHRWTQGRRHRSGAGT